MAVTYGGTCIPLGIDGKLSHRRTQLSLLIHTFFAISELDLVVFESGSHFSLFQIPNMSKFSSQPFVC